MKNNEALQQVLDIIEERKLKHDGDKSEGIESPEFNQYLGAVNELKYLKEAIAELECEPIKGDE